MNLFILAAGKGTRLYPLTKHQPKSLIRLEDGTTILERQIEVALESKGFARIFIITGYHSEMIETCIEKYSEHRVEVIFNPYFDVSNNLFSLWAAHYLLEASDFVISNGDNIYRRGIYQRIFDSAADETTATPAAAVSATTSRSKMKATESIVVAFAFGSNLKLKTGS